MVKNNYIKIKFVCLLFWEPNMSGLSLQVQQSCLLGFYIVLNILGFIILWIITLSKICIINWGLKALFGLFEKN